MLGAKNKSAAAVQITAEQLLREAADRQLEVDFKKPRQKIADAEELAEIQLGKRQGVRPSFARFSLFWSHAARNSLRTGSA
jgi:hypothetical protein